MEPNPYSAPIAPQQPVIPTEPDVDVDRLLAIARSQKGVMLFILLNIAITVGNLYIPPVVRLPYAIIIFFVGVSYLVFVIDFGIKLYGGLAGVLLGLLAMLPLLGLIILLVMNQQAISIFKKHNIPVGFLGANKSDVLARFSGSRA